MPSPKRPQIFQIFVLMLAALWFTPQTAQAADPVVEWSATLTPDSARAGEHVVLEVTAKVPEHWHMYSMNKVPQGPKPLAITVEGQGVEPSGQWYGPKAGVEFDPNFEKEVEFFEGVVIHKSSLSITGAAGERKLTVTAKGQICDPGACVPLKEVMEITLKVEDGEARAQFAKAAPFSGTLYGAKTAAAAGPTAVGPKLDPEAGLLQFLITSFIAGFLALLTPCVFPMIPITIAFFTKHAEVSRKRSVLMAGTYSGAIVVCFTALGVGASLLFGASAMQQTASSIPFNVFMFLLLFLFGLSLMGLFEIGAPRFLLDKSSEMERKYGDEEGPLSRQIMGVFFMGLTFSLMSFTCTVGLVGLLFAQLEGGEHWLYPTMGLFMFAVAFSLPFFLLALFPAAAQRLQGKAGDWMVALKVTLGFIEVAGAFKFLSNIDLVMGWFIFSRPVVLMIWVALFLACGLFLWRILQLGDYETPKNVGVLRMLAGGFFVSFALYSASGFNHTRSLGGWIDAWLPPAVMPDQESVGGDGDGVGEHFAWIKDDIPRALAKGKEADKPVFVDFTGYMCTNCREMEASVFPRPNIKVRLNQMTLAQAYTDCDQDICEEQQTFQKETFDTVALPFYVIYDPFTGEALVTSPYPIEAKVKSFEAFLQSGLDKYDAAKGERKAKAEAAATAAAKAEAVGPAEPKHRDLDVTHVRKGEPIDFHFPSLVGGEDYTLSSDRGSWVLINFWASWCAPCKRELKHDFPPSLAKYPQVKLVTVAFDGDEKKAESAAFMKEIKLADERTLIGGEEMDEAGLPEGFDSESSMLPQTYLVDPQGFIVWAHTSELDYEVLGRLLAPTVAQAGSAAPAGE